MHRLALVLALMPQLAHAAAPHSGEVIHHGFELSDVALAIFAALGVWLAQRSLRRRARAKASAQPKD